MPKALPSLAHWISAFFSRKCPRIIRPRAQRDQPFLVVGHRGSPCVEIENTIPSFHRALDEGANALELDLCLTRDSHVIVWHDWNPSDFVATARRRGLEPDVCSAPLFPDGAMRRPVNELTLAEMREHFGYSQGLFSTTRLDATIPTFEQFMEWAVGQSKLRTVFLDIKIPTISVGLLPILMARVHDAIVRYGPRFTIVLETMHRQVLREMKRIRPGVNYTLDVEMPVGVLLFPFRYSAARAAMHVGNAYATLCRPYSWTVAPWVTFRRVAHHDVKIRDRHNGRSPAVRLTHVIGYTINDEEEMRCLIHMGLDGIYTDRPALLARIAQDMGRKTE